MQSGIRFINQTTKQIRTGHGGCSQPEGPCLVWDDMRQERVKVVTSCETFLSKDGR